MIITCPACQTKYTVPAQSFGATGRVVKCTKCGNKWHQEARETFQSAGTQFDTGVEAPQAQETTQQHEHQPERPQKHAADPTPTDSETTASEAPKSAPHTTDEVPPFAPSNLPALSTGQNPQNIWPGIMLGIAATIGLIGAVLVLKDPMVRAFPAMAQVLGGGSAVVDFDASYSKAPGLVIENIERDILEDDGFTTYVIQGIVTNTNLEEMAVPNLTVSLMDERGGVLDNWKVEPQKRVLQPGESTAWFCYFYNPPLAKVSEYKVAFDA